MSRSYKKHMGGSYCGSSDKYSRSVYHRSKRRADKRNCYELCKKYEIKEIFERESDFCLESNWRHESQNVWQRYQAAVKNKHNYSYDFVDLVVSKNLPKKRFQSCEELTVWFRENQKWLLEVWKKMNYGK